MSYRAKILDRAVYWAAPGNWKPDPEALAYFFWASGCEQVPTVAEATRSLNTLANGCYLGGNSSSNVRHWCGIFACACFVEAGVGCRWTLFGGQIKSKTGVGVTKKWGYAGIQPGDIAIVQKASHHFIITNVTDSTVDSIDGNSTGNMIRTCYSKPLSSIIAYYRPNAD
jgi:hypothetical protein